jgi:aspartyl-tRNA(Asn)/glutamyl-tRNA(Gln) amidotransferase subunit A
MPNPPLTDLTLAEAGDLVRRRDVSPVELLDAVLDRIADLDPRLNAFTTLAPAEETRATARAAEREIVAGRWRGPLHGVPVSVKDLIQTAGLRTTYGSAMFRNHVPTVDGGVPARLRAAGAVITGKTATHEFGKGITTNNYFYGPTRNPWNLDHVPGGSSGGAAAAAAARLGPLHVGTDGGGSIRYPAAFCGVVGLKPTLGLLSNRGELGTGDLSYAVPGPLVRTVRDAAIAAQALAGFDPSYAYSRPGPVPDLLAHLEDGVRGLRIGVSPDLLEPAPDPAVAAAWEAALARLEALGAERRELAFPEHHNVNRCIAFAFGVEGEHGLAELVGERPWELSPALQRMKELAPPVDVAGCVRQQHLRQRIRRDWVAAFCEVDAVVMPAVPVAAPPIAVDEMSYVARCLPYTGAVNLVGLPAAVLPAGRDGALPVAIQVIAAEGADATALRIAWALEHAAPEHRVAIPPGF